MSTFFSNLRAMFSAFVEALSGVFTASESDGDGGDGLFSTGGDVNNGCRSFSHGGLFSTGSELFETGSELFTSSAMSDGPLCNVDGTPMMSGSMFDIKGNAYGVTDDWMSHSDGMQFGSDSWGGCNSGGGLSDW